MPSDSTRVPRTPRGRAAHAVLLFGLVAAGCNRGEPARAASTAGGTPADSGTAAAPQSPDGQALLAYVTNEGSEELSVIDTRTDKVVDTIPVGTRPRGVKVSPDGKTVFVALSGSPRCPPTMPDAECEKLKADKSKDGIAAVDVAARKVTRVLPGGSDPEAFDMSQDGTTLFVSNEDAGTASVVDVASGKIRSTVPVGKEPEGVRVQPDGKAVWVTGETAHNVTVLDVKSGKKIGEVEVGQRPRSIVFTPDGAKAYVACEVDGTVWVIDAPERKRLKVLTMPKDSKPMGSAMAANGKRAYISNGRGGTVSVIDVAADSVVASVPVGQRPWGIALTPDGSKLYTANGPSNDVSVVDVGTLTVTRKIPVGKLPWGVAIGRTP
jgi:YVTN family beta-propeller protein